MILADTSVWIDHLRHGEPVLTRLLETQGVLMHPFVVGELALGILKRRAIIVGSLRDLPQAIIARDEEVLGFIESRALFGKGLGYVDVHLLTSAALTPETLLWTRDKNLRAAAVRLSLHATLI